MLVNMLGEDQLAVLDALYTCRNITLRGIMTVQTDIMKPLLEEFKIHELFDMEANEFYQIMISIIQSNEDLMKDWKLEKSDAIEFKFEFEHKEQVVIKEPIEPEEEK